MYVYFIFLHVCIQRFLPCLLWKALLTISLEKFLLPSSLHRGRDGTGSCCGLCSLRRPFLPLLPTGSNPFPQRCTPIGTWMRACEIAGICGGRQGLAFGSSTALPNHLCMTAPGIKISVFSTVWVMVDVGALGSVKVYSKKAICMKCRLTAGGGTGIDRHVGSASELIGL